ncbi:MAG: DsrH/TusB family sulfur metabolism protein [Candidatus Sulfobium sp.]|jgi:sulfur relay protein TusB/DsrH
MVVLIKSSPDTPEGQRGVRIARDMSADIVLLQNGVYFIQGQRLEDLGIYRATYVLEDDRRLRGLKQADADKNIRDISYDGLVDLMAESDKVTGLF